MAVCGVSRSKGTLSVCLPPPGATASCPAMCHPVMTTDVLVAPPVVQIRLPVMGMCASAHLESQVRVILSLIN